MKAETFKNTGKQAITNTAQALERPKAEVSAEFDGTVVYFDSTAKFRKVDFQRSYGWQSYSYVYLDTDSITQTVSTADPKAQCYPKK